MSLNIAIVAPSPAPFALGGAEKLCLGLLDYLNRFTPHRAELIKLPTRERTFPEIVSSYVAFSRLSLDHFDWIISTKYPSWMVRHEQHVCYMLHPLRGLYDTYPSDWPTEVPGPHSGTLGRLLAVMEQHPGERAALDEVFGLSEQLIAEEAHHPPELLALPGPLARAVVRFLDGVGLAPGAIRRYAAISRTVANRPGYFPPGVEVAIAWPPTALRGLHAVPPLDHPSAGESCFFTVSRLDRPKRLDLLIEAMQRTNVPVRLKIAGTGSDERRLRALAGDDPRIVFLGFVSDAELIVHYAQALAVPYVPDREDFGLVALEAMLSAKPVLTVSDAGGPTELVVDGVTGYVVKPTPAALAERMTFLATHRGVAQKLGAAGWQRAQAVTWEKVTAAILPVSVIPPPKGLSSTALPTEEEGKSAVAPLTPGEGGAKGREKAAHSRPKLTVAITFPIFPPRGGGQSRVYHLYRCLARACDVELVTFAEYGEPPLDREIAPGLREIRIPKSRAHRDGERQIGEQVGRGIPIGDVTTPYLYGLTPAYLQALARSTQRAEIVVACHPYLLPALRDVSNRPLWYEAQDVEWVLKGEILPRTPRSLELLEQTRVLEARCCAESELIMVCTKTDGERLQALYGADPTRLVAVPNGVDTVAVRYVPLPQRRELQRRLGLEGTPTALFIGSWHGPHLTAVEWILKAAASRPAWRFLIVGSASLAFQQCQRPKNLTLLGVVDDSVKDLLLNAVDVALNPIRTGSGTNLKVLDYLAAGAPVVTSQFGARGLDLTPELVHFAEPEELAEALDAFHATPEATLTQRVAAGRRWVRTRFDWKVIADSLLAQVGWA